MVSVHVEIQSVIQADPGEEPELIQQQMMGKLQIAEDEWTLRYIENEGTADEVHTAVKSLSEQLTVVRQGTISYRQTYRTDMTTESVIHMPWGHTEMEVTTLFYERELTEEEGRIHFAFLLNMSNQPLGRYELQICWTNVKE